MNSKYNRSITLIMFISLCMGNVLFAQTPDDTLQTKTLKTRKVDVLYGNQPEWMVTGAISTISGQSLEKQFTSNLASSLIGRVPGLVMQQSKAEPGNESFSMAGRGFNTFGVDKRNMLILVDGFETNYESLVPEEVATVSLLKDAAALSMLGARAANGVLLITTKRGEAGKLKVNFSTQQGFQSALRLPEFLGSYDYARLYNEALVNEGRSPLYTEQQLEGYKNGSDKYLYPDVDWYREILRKSTPISNYNLNFRGGGESVKYYVMLNQVSNSSLYKKTGDESEYSINGSYKRLNLRSNIDINVTKRLSASFTLGGMIADKANPASDLTDNIFNAMQTIAPNAFPVYNANGSIGRSTNYTNPWGDLLYKGFYTSNARTLQTTASFTEQLDFIAKGLSFTGKISFNSFSVSNSSKSRNYESFATQVDQQGNVTYTKYGLNTSLVGNELASGQYRNVGYQAFLNFDRSFGIHDVSTVLMYNEDEYTISGDNFPIRHNFMSGRATYAMNRKYIAEFSGSYMGSANFPKDGRYGFFPAGALAWIVSNESFLTNSSLIRFLKLRASYGMVGNDNIGGTPFMFEQYYPYTYAYYFGTGNSQTFSIIQGSPANRNVTWEKEKIANFGIEATMGRFELSFDVFSRNRADILVIPEVTTPDFVGFTKPYLNLGKASNQGFEAKLGYSTDRSKTAGFFAEANVWYYKNEIKYNGEALQQYPYQYRAGHAIDQPFGLVATGLFKDANDVANSPKQTWAPVSPGDVKYKDQNNDNKIDQNDVLAIGNTYMPNLMGNFHLGGHFKNFDLDVFFQGAANRTVYLSGYAFHAFQNKGKIGEIALDRWTPETASSATYPRLTLDNQNNYRYSTYWMRNGDFLRLRSIELGYSIPQNISQKVRISNARVYVNGTNLFSLDHLENYCDPEVISGYPLMRTYSLGIRLQFN